MKTRLCIVALALLAAQGRGEDAKPAETRYALTAGKPVLVSTKAGTLVRVPGFDLTCRPGEPRVPVRSFRYLLPSDADPGSARVVIRTAETDTLKGVKDLVPGQAGVVPHSRGKSVSPVLSKGAVYRRDALFPESYVTITPEGRLGDRPVVRLDFYPVRVNPVRGILQVVRRTEVSLLYSTKSAASQAMEPVNLDELSPFRLTELDPAVSRKWLTTLRLNPHILDALFPRQGYAIVTTQAIRARVPELDTFIAHKRALGYNVVLVTENAQNDDAGRLGWLETRLPAGADKADHLRAWLQAHRGALRLRFVFIIGCPLDQGDPADVPMKLCTIAPDGIVDGAGEIQSGHCFTDHYYAELSGCWDLNDDGAFATYPADGAVGGLDFYPEVYVGRLPVYPPFGDLARVRLFLSKTIAYEAEADTAWRAQALLPFAFLDDVTDTARAGEYLRGVLEAQGFRCDTAYQSGEGVESAFASTFPLVDGALREWWPRHAYGLVSWAGHGTPWDVELFDPEAVPGVMPPRLWSLDWSMDLDSSRPSLVYSGSCLTSYPAERVNLGLSLLMKGAIGVASATESIYYLREVREEIREGHTSVTVWSLSERNADTQSFGCHFMDRAARNHTFGEAFHETKALFGDDWGAQSWMNKLAFNLYGDPSLALRLPDLR
ncbi:MAG: hypothetical protein KA248_14685 [Kiritimatiellae bacterium]|nr:hypothetical protein [Kiritimatiellia bacterium]